jgi:flagellar hook-associated protein 1 FlgK
MGITNIFNIAQSGLRTQQLGLEVTGENIANVNTPGYSRQRALLETKETVLSSGFPLGSGVDVAQIERSYDSFLQTQITTENSTFGQTSTLQTFVQRIEPIFNEITSDGLGKSLDDFLTSWNNLSLNPQGTAQRQTVLARAQILADNFHQVNTFLNNARTDANKSLVGLTSDINDKIHSIADLNDQIRQIEVTGGNANELRDQRDTVLQELSKVAGIRYLEENDGTMTVTLMSSQVLVLGDKASTVSTRVNATTGLNDIMVTPFGGGAPMDVTSSIGGPNNSLGQIGGTLNVRDTLIPDKLAKVDELAYNLATALNALHTTGFGLTGSTGNNFFTPGAMTGYSLAINVNITSINDVAASATAGLAGDNTMALSIAALRDQNMATTFGTTTLTGFYNALAGDVGIEVQRAERSYARSESLINQLNTLRESTSGVSLDEELMNLAKYQKAYAGTAKLVNAATEMMDIVLGLIR